ncbi:MAG: M23 family metallopeptidase [Deltaproteobacteria bacterium]|nr:M23 family metallopeptidase [Deltaproteobacteria bacterium]
MRWIVFITVTVSMTSCITNSANLYETAKPLQIAHFKQLPIPLPRKTITTVRQGAFGKSSHNEPGNQYNWDFETPLGTPVVAAEDGVVIDVWKPNRGGGCDAAYAAVAHNIKIEHTDGTVAQYVHIDTPLRSGDRVAKGQTIAHTAVNGWICYPHLHFGVYASRNNLYSSPARKTLPIYFLGIPDGIAREGDSYIVP